jgi:hypothetical protein
VRIEKVEIGQGVQTAPRQIAAEGLDVAAVLPTADTIGRAIVRASGVGWREPRFTRKRFVAALDTVSPQLRRRGRTVAFMQCAALTRLRRDGASLPYTEPLEAVLSAKHRRWTSNGRGSPCRRWWYPGPDS